MTGYDRGRNAAEYAEIGYGWDVVGSDGAKIGSVAAIQPHYISVEKGFLFKEDIFIPTTAITSVRDEVVYLNVSKDQIENQDWSRDPEMTERHHEAARYNEQMRTGRTRIPLAEEHLDVQKREVERGSVHVHKDVVEEEESINVPLREEEVRVERHDRRTDQVTGEIPADAFQEQDIEIPIRGEEAVVTKRARVREEVDISKDVHERDEQVRDTVRREEVHVDHDDTLREERDRP